MLREVRLYGHLGQRFGRMHRFDVASPAEAVRALVANFATFENYLLEHSAPGYRVWVGERNIAREHLRNGCGKGEAIRIVPVVAGAKRAGVVNIILGAVLIVVGYFAFGATTEIGATLIGSGIASIIGGVVQLFARPPPGPKERPENQPSFFFDGAVNTTAQGQPVPLLYGRLIVGSAVISTGINAEELAIVQPAAPPPPPLPPEEDIVYWEVGAGP